MASASTTITESSESGWMRIRASGVAGDVEDRLLVDVRFRTRC